MAVTITRQDFLNDDQGKRYGDVVSDPRVNLNAWLAFFNDAQRQRRMLDAEVHFGHPALAGVVRELEHDPAFKPYLANSDAHTTTRGRQTIGVLVRLIMEAYGWRKTGRKGSLGNRRPSTPGTTAPGAYQNTPGSISQWFTRAEHYAPPGPYAVLDATVLAAYGWADLTDEQVRERLLALDLAHVDE